jgi:hypothetical protein
MKKMIALLLTLVMLSGCAVKIAPTTVPTSAPETTAPAMTTIPSTVPETTVPETTVEETVPETTVEETVPETTAEETVPETTEEPTEHVHNYEKTKVEPTCTEKGYTLYTCECGDSYEDNEKKPKGHNVEKWKTLSREGITLEQEGTCSRCGEKQTRTKIEYPNGNYKAGVINGASHYQDKLDACALKIYEITKPWMDAGLSDYQKIKNAFMWLQENVGYLQDLPKDTSKLNGAILNGRADCWGYATAFQYLCHAMYIDCYFVLPAGEWHSWNIVKLDGKYYHVDATHGIFLYSTDEIGRHQYDQNKFPVCDEICPYPHGFYWDWWDYHDHSSDETKPPETEPVETEPADTEPIVTEPVQTEPIETEPVVTEPVETEPSETVPLKTIPATEP